MYECATAWLAQGPKFLEAIPYNLFLIRLIVFPLPGLFMGRYDSFTEWRGSGSGCCSLRDLSIRAPQFENPFRRKDSKECVLFPFLSEPLISRIYIVPVTLWLPSTDSKQRKQLLGLFLKKNVLSSYSLKISPSLQRVEKKLKKRC